MIGQDGPSLIRMAIGSSPQGPQPQQGPDDILTRIAGQMGRQAVRESQGWGESTLFHGLNFAKTLADGTASLGGLVWQGLRAAGSTITDLDPAGGWEAGAKDIEEITGTRSPSFLDYADIGIAAATGEPRRRGLGDATEQMIQERLGRAALFSGAAGTLASFATGPGAFIGKAGAKAAAPLAHVAERVIARRVAKGVMTKEAADALVSSGQFWSTYAKDLGPGVGLAKRLLAAGGRNAEELLGVTAGNVLQSYAMTGEDERVDGAVSALITSPFLIPLARMGSSLANYATRNRLAPDEVKAAMGIYDRMAKGELSPSGANDAFRKVLPRHYRALNALVSGAFEGTAFTALDPQGKERWAAAIGGDTDAMKELLLLSAGSVAGLATLKYGMPADLAPMFRQIRPELDTLQLRIEAEAAKQAAEEAGQGPTDVRPDPAGKISAEQGAAELDRILMSKQEALQKKWGSYQGLTQAPIRAGWEPTFDADSLGLMFGDSTVRLSQSNGELSLSLDAKAQEALAEVGIKSTTLTGPEAQEALDKLTLLSLRGQVIASQRLQDIGFQEVDGRWVLPEEGVEARPNLDGSTTLVDVFTGEPTGRSVPVPTAEPRQEKFEHPTLGMFAESVYAKQALAPDPVIDPILIGAINEARNGDGPGADVLRKFFAAVPPDQLMARLSKDQDDALAFWLGAAVRGHGNAKSMLEGFARQMGAEQIGKEVEAGNEMAQAMAARPTGEELAKDAAENFVPLLEQAQRQDYVDAMEQGVQRQFLSDKLGDTKPDEPRQSEAYGGIPIPPEIVNKAKETGQSLYDVFFESAPEALRAANPKSDFPDRLRQGSSEGLLIRGKVMSETGAWEAPAKKIKAALREEVKVEGQPYTKPRWIAGAQGEIQGRTKAEQKVFDGLRQSLGSLWKTGVDMQVMNVRQNPETADYEFMPITERDRAVVPREYHQEFHDEIMAKEPMRRAYFDEIAANNEIMVRDKETKKPRRATGEDLEQAWRESNAKEGVNDPEKQTAIEYIRQVKNIPTTFKGKKVLETDMFKAMRNIIAKQSARLGTIKVFGQDLPEAVRRKYGIEKTGVTKALEAYKAPIADKSIQKLATTTVEILQGKQPRESDKARKAISFFTLGPIENITRAAQTFAAFVHDVFPLHFAASTGVKRMARALYGVARDRGEAFIAAERAGTLMRDMGPTEISEADFLPQVVVDAYGWLGKKTEQLKTVVATRLADLMLADWKAGKVTANDRGVVRDMLRYRPEDANLLVSGKAPEALQNQFRQEMVQFLTDRTPQALASQFAQSPNMMRLFRFARWATGRMRNVARTTVAFHRARKYGTPAEQRAAAMRMFNTFSLMTVGGLAGQALSYLWVDMFRDPSDPLGGLERWWQEASYAPATMVGKALRNQLIGGPFAQVVGAAMDTGDASAWARTTAPGSAIYNIASQFEAPTSPTTPLGVLEAISKGISSAATGTLLPRELVALMASATHIGQDRDLANMSRTINRFERIEGIERPEFQREKSEAFYDAMADVRTAMAKHPDDREAAFREAMAGIRAALELESSASVASAIRARRFLSSYDNARREAFADFVGDEKVMEKAYEHDAALTELARAVGRMEGAQENSFETELGMVRNQARMGAADRWKPLADRVVDEASVALSSQTRPTDDMQELAMAMAYYPEHATAIFSERQARAIGNRRLGIGARARMIYGVLASRARNKAKEAMRERAEERR